MKKYFVSICFLLVCSLLNVTLAGDQQGLKKNFDGLPDDEVQNINKLLTYQNSNHVMTLTPGASAYILEISYGQKVDPDNVVVNINGEDISHFFRPEQGQHEIIELPLVIGENHLSLRALELITNGSGATPSWDYDEFVIILPRFEVGVQLFLEKNP